MKGAYSPLLNNSVVSFRWLPTILKTGCIAYQKYINATAENIASRSLDHCMSQQAERKRYRQEASGRILKDMEEVAGPVRGETEVLHDIFSRF